MLKCCNKIIRKYTINKNIFNTNVFATFLFQGKRLYYLTDEMKCKAEVCGYDPDAAFTWGNLHKIFGGSVAVSKHILSMDLQIT